VITACFCDLRRLGGVGDCDQKKDSHDLFIDFQFAEMAKENSSKDMQNDGSALRYLGTEYEPEDSIPSRVWFH